jgi:hypothetical protein
VAIAYAAENTAAPTSKPITGASFDWTGTGTGQAVFGWTLAADLTTGAAFKFSEDDFAFNDSDGKSAIVVKSPTSVQKVAIIEDQPQILDNIELTSYEAGRKVMSMATNWTEATGVFTKGVHTTRRALIIEIGGLGFHYMPSVEIDAKTPGGGVHTLATEQVVIQVFAGSSVTSGYQFHQYADA